VKALAAGSASTGAGIGPICQILLPKTPDELVFGTRFSDRVARHPQTCQGLKDAATIAVGEPASQIERGYEITRRRPQP